ncbi:MAG: cysteine--tRNA ligase [Clostridiales bacterium]|nr:cysteine--tRNA ligase [Clostridiales bacterium]
MTGQFYIHNTLTRRKELFTKEPGQTVTMYTCGPTVYDYTHIGHLRPALVTDILCRWLRHLGYPVHSIMNFTDIDDRIIQKAQDEGVSFEVIARRYMEDFLENMERLGMDQVTEYIQATHHIPAITRMVEGLLEKGYAYRLNGDVYFDVTRFERYGALSGRSLEELQAGARVQVDERKRHPADFALWKGAKEGEPYWDTAVGPGRPGWHIECSAMVIEHFGSTVDFHLGGDDLIFPHHENEIAQSECYTGHHPFARYWVHNAMVQVEGEKMSKSLKNFVTLRSLLSRHRPETLRFFLLSTHYRKPLQYSEEGLEEAARAFARLQNAYDRLKEALEHGEEGGPSLEEPLSRARAAFTAALNDDLNTPAALAALFDLARAIQRALREHPRPRGSAQALEGFRELLALLGLRVERPEERGKDREGMADRLVEILLTLRLEARQAGQWLLADRIRDELSEVGVVVEDTPGGYRWKWRHE